MGALSTITNATVTVVYSVAVGVLAFGADGLTVGVGLGKGAWVGLWILYVIWPALLMHHFASTVGMTALGRVLSTILPRRSENVLLLAWILPSFIQGVSGSARRSPSRRPCCSPSGWAPPAASRCR